MRRPSVRSLRHSKTATALLLGFFLAFAACAWLCFLFSTPPHCWQHQHSSPLNSVAFPWEPLYIAPPPLHPLPNATTLPLSSSSSSSSSASASASDSASSDALALSHLVFGIAGSAQLWPKRQHYVKFWWRPLHMRGFIWLEQPVEIPPHDAPLLPQILVSQDVSAFRYTHSTGHPSGVRIARVIQEMFKLHLSDVRWFVMGDDDTVFSPDNLLRVLRKYDPSELYYVGNPSESHSANTYFSHGMAFGGGGIAISYPLAEALSEMLDGCLERYPFLFGSDDRLHACITELGVPLTREAGFHQFDVHGDAFGLLAAHPIAPFISMHHLDEVDPVFPNMDAQGAMERLANAMHTEPSSFLQQCICYDRAQKLSFSVSLGYVVQVYPYIVFPRELERPEITFKAWNQKDGRGEFDVDTRRYSKSICRRPFVFFLESIHMKDNQTVVSTYKRDTSIDERKRRSFCFSRVLPPEEVEQVQVVSRPLSDHWFSVPRRQCCKVMGVNKKQLGITVAPCQYGKDSSR